MTREEIEKAWFEYHERKTGVWRGLDTIDFALLCCARQAEEDANAAAYYQPGAKEREAFVIGGVRSVFGVIQKAIAEAIRANAPKVDK